MKGFLTVAILAMTVSIANAADCFRRSSHHVNNAVVVEQQGVVVVGGIPYIPYGVPVGVPVANLAPAAYGLNPTYYTGPQTGMPAQAPAAAAAQGQAVSPCEQTNSLLLEMIQELRSQRAGASAWKSQDTGPAAPAEVNENGETPEEAALEHNYHPSNTPKAEVPPEPKPAEPAKPTGWKTQGAPATPAAKPALVSTMAICATCHRGAAPRGNIAFDRPLTPELKWKAFQAAQSGKMPPKKPLNNEQLQILMEELKQ